MASRRMATHREYVRVDVSMHLHAQQRIGKGDGQNGSGVSAKDSYRIYEWQHDNSTRHCTYYNCWSSVWNKEAKSANTPTQISIVI